jgi:hypothetical protein
MPTGCVRQWSFVSRKTYANPFADVEVNAVVTGPGGAIWRVPAFWAGGAKWAFRFAGPRPGSYTFRTECSDLANAGLHNREGAFKVVRYRDVNPLYRHGRLRVASDRRHFEHADGKPFFWLGDTWWMGLTDRLRWKSEIATLTADRVSKGFSVVQIVAGLYPDMDWQDSRGANEAGFPYDKAFERVNPRWYDFADRKIVLIADSGMAPCIVGCWGYYLMWMGLEKARRHWRYLVARYGAYPVFWCLAGEATMPYYDLFLGPKADPAEADRHRAVQKAGWTEVTRYVRGIDPFHNPVSVHGASGRACVEDDRLVDFNMLESSHDGYESIPGALSLVRTECAREPLMPVVHSEVNYEGILGRAKDDVQRATFWVCILNGLAGYTYGANGVWQLNRPEKPYGPSPHGATWGNRSWQDAYKLPGSAVVGLGKRLLQKYAWWQFQPHPEWSGVPESAQKWDLPQVAGIPGKVMVLYYHNAKAAWAPPDAGRLSGLVPRGAYRAKWIDPESGLEYRLGRITADADGRWLTPRSPIIGSILLILERIAR